MALDEYLFGKIANYFKRKTQLANEKVERTISLDDIQERLTLIARAIAGVPINIFPAEREGGYKGHHFFLPTSCALFDTQEKNLSLYFFRVIYLAVQQKLNYNSFDSKEMSLEKARELAEESAPTVLAEAEKEFPVIKELHQELKKQLQATAKEKKPPDFTWLYGKWMKDEKAKGVGNELNDFTEQAKKASEEKTETVIKAKAVEEVIVTEVDKKQQEDYVMNHYFEKVETADEHDGGWRDFDGEDELEKHQNALDELNMKYVVRTDDMSHSIYQAEFTENTNISESKESESKDFHHTYDEWNFSKKEYKRNYCKVYPTGVDKMDKAYYDKTISENQSTLNSLRKMLTSINNKMQQQRRQKDGGEIDLDAVTDLFVDVQSGHTPSENVYLSNRKKEKDISILLLLDASLSSDGYADGNRVIDVEKQVSILFGEIMNEQHIDFSVQCFFSKTRNYTTYTTLKGFDEEWNKAKNNIGSIQPSGFTRIGPALRHSGALLANRDTKNKWLILLSDGKPNDYDRYEGKYGIQDVKQALRELRQQRINSYALAIESRAKYYLPQMFGQNHYQIISTPVELINSLVKLYEKIKYV